MLPFQCQPKLEMSPRTSHPAGPGMGKAAVDCLLGLRVAAGDARQALTVAVYASLRLRCDLRPEVGGA